MQTSYLSGIVKFVTTIIIVLNSFLPVFSNEKPDSIIHENSVSLDILPLYHVLFDNRTQIRAGLEYKKNLIKKSFLACYLDLGLYDKYDFIKYYDFFNQNQNMYSIQQKVLILGFHLLPSYNYYFYGFRKKPNEGFFGGAIMDFGYYKKKASYYNSLTLDNHSEKYSQTKLGMGLGLGFKKYFDHRMFIELKTSLLIKLYNYISENGRNPIKSLDAQWTSPGYNFWWISNIKAGYAF